MEREYAVRVFGRIDDEQQRRLLEGVELEDGVARVRSIVDGGGEGANHWYNVVLSEGRNREVRRLMEAIGLQVSRLIRTRFGPVAMPPQLKQSMRIELEGDELQRLLSTAGLASDGGPRGPVPGKDARGGGPRRGDNRPRGHGQAKGQGPLAPDQGPRRSEGQGQGRRKGQGQRFGGGQSRPPGPGNGEPGAALPLGGGQGELGPEGQRFGRPGSRRGKRGRRGRGGGSGEGPAAQRPIDADGGLSGSEATGEPAGGKPDSGNTD
jgi:23S rRNA pseudouridine2605 synthase